MISRGIKFQLLVFLIITALGVSYTGVRYVGLGDALLNLDYRVAVELPRTAGLFENGEVTYRGVPVGRVAAIDLTEDGVRATLEIDQGTRIPKDVTAVVQHRSAAGEQYLDLRPNRSSGPYLADGSVIPRSATKVPIKTSTFLLNLEGLINSVPRDDLMTVLDELDRAFSGTGPELRRLVEASNALIEEADSALPETIALLQDGRTVLDTQRASASSIRTFSDNLESLTRQIRDSDPDLRRTLDAGAPAAVQLEGLLSDIQPTLPILLANLVTTGQIVKVRIPGLRQVFVTYPLVVGAAYSAVPGDGTAHFGLVLNLNEPPPCTKGYQSTDERYPQETADTPANTKVRCAEPPGSETGVRGARNAPSSGMPSGAAAAPGGSQQRDTKAKGSGSPVSAAGGKPYVTSYDPITGRFIGPDGGAYVLGSTGGHQRVLGKDSWKWLLLGPLVG